MNCDYSLDSVTSTTLAKRSYRDTMIGSQRTVSQTFILTRYVALNKFGKYLPNAHHHFLSHYSSFSFRARDCLHTVLILGRRKPSEKHAAERGACRDPPGQILCHPFIQIHGLALCWLHYRPTLTRYVAGLRPDSSKVAQARCSPPMPTAHPPPSGPALSFNSLDRPSSSIFYRFFLS